MRRRAVVAAGLILALLPLSGQASQAQSAAPKLVCNGQTCCFGDACAV